MSISDVRARDRALSSVALNVEDEIPAALRGTRFEKTGDVLAHLVSSVGSLKDGILDLAEASNVYGTNALFRVFLEHMLKTLALFMKGGHDGTDDFANQYIRLRIHEAGEYLRAYEAAKLDMTLNPKSVLDPWFSEAQALSRKQLNELAEPFRYKALIEYINSRIGEGGPNFLTKIIPNYSELSGFVHGGPSTVLILALQYTDDRKASELEQIADLALSMFCSAKRWLLMLASSVRSEYQAPHGQFDDAMRRWP